MLKLVLKAFAVTGIAFVISATALFLWRGGGADLLDLRTFLVVYFLCAMSALFWALARVIAHLEQRDASEAGGSK